MHKQKRIICIIAAIGVLSIFMPWVHMPIAGYIFGTHQESAWIGAVMYCIPIAYIFIGDRKMPLTSLLSKLITALPGALVSLFGLYDLIDIKRKLYRFAHIHIPFSKAIANSIHFQLGLYIFVLAGIFIFITTFAMNISSVKANQTKIA
jgi:hypothetical protein